MADGSNLWLDASPSLSLEVLAEEQVKSKNDNREAKDSKIMSVQPPVVAKHTYQQ